PDEDGRRLDSQRFRFAELRDRFLRRQLERLAPLELWDDVVVVSVEPLRHLHGGHVAAFSLAAARHGEVGVEIDLAPLPSVARRQRADQRAGVENQVVERGIVAGGAVQASDAMWRAWRGGEIATGGHVRGMTTV